MVSQSNYSIGQVYVSIEKNTKLYKSIVRLKNYARKPTFWFAIFGSLGVFCAAYLIKDLDVYIFDLFGITKPNIAEKFELVSLNHTEVFDEYFILALSKSNCVSGSNRTRIIYRKGRTIQNNNDTNSVVHQLISSVPFVENTELFYKEIFITQLS